MMWRWLARIFGFSHPQSEERRQAMENFLADAESKGLGKRSAELRRINRRISRRRKTKNRNTTKVTAGKYRG